MSAPVLSTDKWLQSPDLEIQDLPENRLRHVTAGYGAFGVAKEYQMLLMLHTHMTANPEDKTPPCLLELNSFNEGDDNNRGPAYHLKKSYLALNFPASVVDPRAQHATDSDLTMDLVRDMEAKDFCDWIDAERENLHPSDIEAARLNYLRLQDAGLTEIQIAAEMEYGEYKTYRLSCKASQGQSEWSWDSYYPRSFYGEYLEDRKARGQALIAEINAHYGQDVVICNPTQNQRIAEICKVDPNGDEFCFSLRVDDFQNGSYMMRTSMLTIATGHFYNEQFLPDAVRADLRKSKRFTDSPYHDHEIIDMLKQTGGEMHIGGAGASMLDAIRGAEVWEGLPENRGKKAKITIVTPKPDIKVWGYDLKKNGNHYGGEQLATFFMTDLEGMKDEKTLQSVKDLLSEYIHSEQGITEGPQNFFEALSGRKNEFDEILDDQAEAFWKFADRYASTTTSPESYESYKRFLDNDQMDFVAAYIDGAGIIKNDDGTLTVPYKDPNTGDEKTLVAKGLSDCFSLANAPFYEVRNPKNAPKNIKDKSLEIDGKMLYVPDPLTRDALAKGILVPDLKERSVAAHSKYASCIAVTGAGASRARGVPYSQALINANAITFTNMVTCWSARVGQSCAKTVKAIIGNRLPANDGGMR